MGNRDAATTTTMTTPGVPTSPIVPPLIFRLAADGWLLPNGLNFRVLSPLCTRAFFRPRNGIHFCLAKRVRRRFASVRRTLLSVSPILPRSVRERSECTFLRFERRKRKSEGPEIVASATNSAIRDQAVDLSDKEAGEEGKKRRGEDEREELRS